MGKVCVKKFVTLAVTAGLIVSLSGCAEDPEEVGGLDLRLGAGSCQPSGSEVESIDFSGAFGEAPVVAFDAPLAVSSTQRLVLIEGDGEVVENGDDVLIDYSLYNATSGEMIEESRYDEFSPTVFNLNIAAPIFAGVAMTVKCATTGSRVAGLIPAQDAFGPDGAPEFGLNAGEPVLFIFDVISIKPPPIPPLDRVEGELSEPAEGSPAVEYADDGSPSVTIPEGQDIPTEFSVDTVITGTGAEVAAGDVVILHYHGVNWNTGEVFDSSWSRGQPASFPTGGVIVGFRDGLIGQTVGSRAIIIIPPELGYGPGGGTPDGSIGAEDTIVFVVDILGLQ